MSRYIDNAYIPYSNLLQEQNYEEFLENTNFNVELEQKKCELIKEKDNLDRKITQTNSEYKKRFEEIKSVLNKTYSEPNIISNTSSNQIVEISAKLRVIAR